MNPETAKRSLFKILKKRNWNVLEVQRIIDRVVEPLNTEVNVNKVIFAASQILNVSAESILNKNRFHNSVKARSFCYNYLRDKGWILQRIGKEFNKHHATILHSLETFDSMLEYEKGFREDYERFIKLLEER